jgi:hypothetical protein
MIVTDHQTPSRKERDLEHNTQRHFSPEFIFAKHAKEFDQQSVER